MMFYIWVQYLMDHPVQNLPCFMALLIYQADTKILTRFNAVIGLPHPEREPLISWTGTVPNIVHKGVQIKMEMEITRCDIKTVGRAVHNPPAVAS
jgi:hypothetical protein